MLANVVKRDNSNMTKYVVHRSMVVQTKMFQILLMCPFASRALLRSTETLHKFLVPQSLEHVPKV